MQSPSQRSAHLVGSQRLSRVFVGPLPVLGVHHLQLRLRAAISLSELARGEACTWTHYQGWAIGKLIDQISFLWIRMQLWLLT